MLCKFLNHNQNQRCWRKLTFKLFKCEFHSLFCSNTLTVTEIPKLPHWGQCGKTAPSFWGENVKDSGQTLLPARWKDTADYLPQQISNHLHQAQQQISASSEQKSHPWNQGWERQKRTNIRKSIWCKKSLIAVMELLKIHRSASGCTIPAAALGWGAQQTPQSCRSCETPAQGCLKPPGLCPFPLPHLRDF